MDYNELEHYLLDMFNKNNYLKSLQSNQRNSKNSNIPNNFGINLSISFPGYKSYIKNNIIVYDYRVDLNNMPISHANIATDIYSKCVQAPMLRKDLYNFLIELAINALNIDLSKYNKLMSFKFKTPSRNLLNRVVQAHGFKRYNLEGNNHNFSLEELSIMIPYIVLQEDINYPMPKFNGRRMSFYRYIESMLCTSQNNIYTIENVISRALSHSRPGLWSEYNRYYEPIKNLSRNLLIQI